MTPPTSRGGCDTPSPASRVDRLFSIAFGAHYYQWYRERMSRARDSRGLRTLTNDLHREGYIQERCSLWIVEHLKLKKCLIIEADERNISYIPPVKTEFKQR